MTNKKYELVRKIFLDFDLDFFEADTTIQFTQSSTDKVKLQNPEDFLPVVPQGPGPHKMLSPFQ